MKKVLSFLVLPLAVLSLFFFLNCAQNEKKGEKKEEKKVITLSGAFAIYPTAVQWAEAFQKLHPDVKVEVSAGGAGKGAADCIAGLVDIGMVSREPDPAELQKGILAVPICHDGVFVIISEKNPAAAEIMAKGMTRTILYGMYKDQKILNWEEIAGLKAKTKTPVSIYTRSDACGAAATFAKFLGKLKQEDLTGIGINSDPQMINAVLNDANGISYTNFSYIFNKDGSIIQGAKVVSIDANENGKIDPEELIESRANAMTFIEKGTYPIGRTNFFFLRTKPIGILKEFMDFCLGEEGTKILNEVGTSLPLPKDKRDQIVKEVI
jgi:phosphate transport system substrate-binding protein